MSKAKKTVLIVSLVLLSFLFGYFAATRVVPFLYFSHVSLWKHNADFEHCGAEFCAVKDYMTEHFASETERIVAISRTGEAGVRFFDHDTGAYVDIPDEIKPSVETILRYGFPDKDADLSTVRIRGDRVAFCIETGSYALVYSPDEKPRWMVFPDEEYNIKIKKITDGWYHVVRDPGW